MRSAAFPTRCVACLALLVAGCGGDDAGSPAASDPASTDVAADAVATAWFADESSMRGIEFTHDGGARGAFRLPESLGAGCALFDADGDGDLDVYLVRGHNLDAAPDATTGGNRFFRNDGTGHFTDDTAASGLAHLGYSCGVAAGDIDGDGDVDLYLANLGPDRLLVNDGSGRFTTADDDAFGNDDGYSVAPCLLDVDRDGDLDLFIARYMDWSPEIEVECSNLLGGRDYCNPEVYGRGIADRLLINDGRGRFTDATESSGIGAVTGTGLAAAAADLDGDGWPDIMVANDKTPDRLWINQRDGTFREEGTIRGCATGLDGSPRAGMSVSFADLDRDGDLEIHVSNIHGEADGLFENRDGRFLDRANAWGIASTSRTRTRWSGRFLDLDVDGDLDLLVACGRVLQLANAARADRPYAEPYFVYLFGENGRFAAIESPWPSDLLPEATHGVAVGDVNGDGFDDLLAVSRDGPARLLIRTPAADTPSPVRFDLRTQAGAPAIGARLSITTAAGTQDFAIDTAGGYASAGSHVVAVAGPVTSIRVRWSDGTERTLDGPFAPGDVVRVVPADS